MNGEKNMGGFRKKLLIAMMLLTALFIAGVAGYVLLERWPIFDAIYMTVITLATVGYSETRPLTFQGRVFTVFLIVFGFGAFIYAVIAVKNRNTGAYKHIPPSSYRITPEDVLIVIGSPENVDILRKM